MHGAENLASLTVISIPELAQDPQVKSFLKSSTPVKIAPALKLEVGGWSDVGEEDWGVGGSTVD